MKAIKRLMMAAILSLILVALCTYYYQNHELHEKYPGNDKVIAGYEGQALLGGTAMEGGRIKITHSPESMVLEVVGGLKAQEGDPVEIQGLVKDGRIIPEKVLVNSRWNYLFLLGRSVVAIPILLYLFFREWRFDLTSVAFRRRDA